MGLGNVNIKLENGALGRVATTNDGVAGLIVTGKAVAEKLDLNKVYLFSGTRDLTTHGITEEGNPLLYKEITAFYEQAGDGRNCMYWWLAKLRRSRRCVVWRTAVL